MCEESFSRVNPVRALSDALLIFLTLALFLPQISDWYRCNVYRVRLNDVSELELDKIKSNIDIINYLILLLESTIFATLFSDYYHFVYDIIYRGWNAIKHNQTTNHLI